VSQRTHIPPQVGSTPTSATSISNMSEPTKPEPNLDDIAAAMNAVDGRTPSNVLEAFLPKPVTHLGQKLVPLSAGHELLLAQISHPLATGTKWEDSDVLMALFVFSRPSRLLFAMVADSTFEAEFFAFIDTIPTADIPKLGQDMVSHWMRSRATALAMESEHSTGQKKTADLDGGSTQSPPHAKSTAGFRRWLSTTFRFAKSSR
jgi:hypothetical protein